MNTAWQILWVACGGALGAVTRFGISETTRRWYGGYFRVGTLIANLAGCFLVGLVMGSGLAEKYPTAKFGLGIGFLGALTTFSTFKAETIASFDAGNWTISIANVLISVVGGLAMVVVGIHLGQRWLD